VSIEGVDPLRGTGRPATLQVSDVPDDPAEFQDFVHAEGWTDGLPVVPPTRALVDRMIEGAGRPGSDLLGVFPPSRVNATVEFVAVNAVMAGCRPDYMPAVVGAIEALLRPEVNMLGVQATTHPAGFMLLFNGPYAQRIGIPAGSGLLGPGFRASATIGRAIRLCQMNIGGALPGAADRSTHGSPAKFSLCFRENVEESPWDPYHVELGFDQDEDTVTVLSCEGPHNINDHVSTAPLGLLRTFATSLTSIGKNSPYLRDSDFFLGFGPEHAHQLANEGWSKQDVREYLFAYARMRFEDWKVGGMHAMYPVPKYFSALGDGDLVPIVDQPEDIRIIVIGGPGRHSCWFPSFGVNRSVTVSLHGEGVDGSENHDG
jgi:hypothetical protein